MLATGHISNVNLKGFAFAKTNQGDVFISPKVFEALGNPSSGTKVELKVKQGKKGLAAQMPRVDTSCNWRAWQVGELALKLPNTQPSSKHTISLGCFRCGEEIVAGAGIFQLRNATVWTAGLPSSVVEGKAFFNKYKKTEGCSAHCRKCNFNMGSIYRARYEGADAQMMFPCARLTCMRERQRDDALLSGVVLLAESRAAAEIDVARLVLVDEDSSSSSCRITGHTYELMQKLKVSEERGKDAEERELNILSGLDKLEREKVRIYKHAHRQLQDAQDQIKKSEQKRRKAEGKLYGVQVCCCFYLL